MAHLACSRRCGVAPAAPRPGSSSRAPSAAWAAAAQVLPITPTCCAQCSTTSSSAASQPRRCTRRHAVPAGSPLAASSAAAAPQVSDAQEALRVLQQASAATEEHGAADLVSAEAALDPSALSLDQLCEALQLAASLLASAASTSPAPDAPHWSAPQPPQPQPAAAPATAPSDAAFPSQRWVEAAMRQALERCGRISEDDATGMTQLAQLAWAAAELHSALHPPTFSASSPASRSDAATASATSPATAAAAAPPPLAGAVAERMLAGVEAGGFLAPDLSRVLCALGTLGWRPATRAEARRVGEEVRLQLREFLSDFAARDVALLAMGLADLGLCGGGGSGGGAAAEDEALGLELRERLMKAAYSKVRTISDKAAVDFALGRLDAEDKSMHYDPRWTHEELRWLPRRERDKRRIIQEGFYRTQWGGWRPGGQ